MSDISELFERDPLLLTDQDIAKIVTRMREAQAQYELSGTRVSNPKPPKSTKTQTLLKDLGLT